MDGQTANDGSTAKLSKIHSKIDDRYNFLFTIIPKSTNNFFPA